MSRFLTLSSRRLFAVAALVTATAVPSVIVAGQTAAGAKTTATTTPTTLVTNGGKMH
ncbi:MAG TPA: hypothetical protein VH914_02740 [Acidimicrobiia bacterium]|jgi:hypothetical protein|nr:hypothetical protein [Acidimicrobiia bacterium]